MSSIPSGVSAIDTATTPPSTPNMAFTYGQMGEWLLVHSMKYAEPGNPMGERWIPLRSFWPETTLKHRPKFRSGRYRYVTRSIDFEWLADQLPDNPLGKPYYPRYSPTDVPTSYTNPLRGFGHPTYLWANPLEWLAEMTSLTARLGHKEIHRLDPKALKLLSHAFGNVKNAYIQGLTNEGFLPPNDTNRALFPTPLKDLYS